MPWFKIDDKAHSHPKFMRAGNAALGLWLRCGSYSAQHLTEGIVSGVVAQLYGTAPQAAKLVKHGLWHEAGHDCVRCPQPNPGDYVIHDFFEGGRNVTRAQHEANKTAAAERAAKSRAARKASGFADDSSSKTDRFEDESKTNPLRKEPHFSGSTAGQDGLSHRTPADGVTHTHATTTPLPGSSFGTSSAAAAREADSDIRPYDTLGDLKRAIAAAGITGVSWNLQASQIERARQVRERVGVEAMVAMALSNARYRGAPGKASAWLADWESLEPEAPQQPGTDLSPAALGANVVRLQPGLQRPATSDIRTQQAIETGRRLQALADAQNQETQ
ncbi:mucin-2 [Streptomyces sp. NPDC059015]|uniref:mucin-2 n=1 Tax=unclassified Streptomyces TaxID=2593676 RepID=UPI0036CA1E40